MKGCILETAFRTESIGLRSFARKCGLPRAEVEDLLQDVWLQAVKREGRFQGEDAPRRLHCWLRSVVKGNVMDLLRRLWRRTVQSLDEMTDQPRDHRQAQADAAAEWEGQRLLLNAFLEQLQAKDRRNHEVLRRILDGQTRERIAVEVNLTADAVRARLRRFIRDCRAWAEREPPPPG